MSSERGEAPRRDRVSGGLGRSTAENPVGTDSRSSILTSSCGLTNCAETRARGLANIPTSANFALFVFASMRHTQWMSRVAKRRR